MWRCRACGERQKPTRLRAVFRLLCQTTQVGRTKISAQWYRSRHNEPPGVCHVESDSARIRELPENLKISGIRYKPECFDFMGCSEKVPPDSRFNAIPQTAASAEGGRLAVHDACHSQSCASGECRDRPLSPSSDFATDRGGNWVGSNSLPLSSIRAISVSLFRCYHQSTNVQSTVSTTALTVASSTRSASASSAATALR